MSLRNSEIMHHESNKRKQLRSRSLGNLSLAASPKNHVAKSPSIKTSGANKENITPLDAKPNYTKEKSIKSPTESRKKQPKKRFETNITVNGKKN